MTQELNCRMCKKLFDISELQLSHDVPRYIGGIDTDGRHYLCKKCHDIYERQVFSAMVKFLPEQTKKEMRERAKKYAASVFKKAVIKNGLMGEYDKKD